MKLQSPHIAALFSQKSYKVRENRIKINFLLIFKIKSVS